MRVFRIRRLAASAALGLAALASLGAIVACSDHGAHAAPGARSASSSLNTASGKTFENSATLVDITDAPVSLPSEKVIYPPSTGNAGTLSSDREFAAAVVLLGTALIVTAAARIVTARRSPHP